VTAFVALHLGALIWWLIPADGYPQDARSADLPAWLVGAEQRVFGFKKTHGTSIFSRGLESYAFLTGTRQYWSMFAPNPPDGHDWLTVLAVIDWEKPDPGAPAPAFEPPWGNDRVPITDPVPLYRSYEGNLYRRMGGHASLYSDAPKLAENLVSGDWNQALASFGEYWALQYREENGKKPLGIIVMDRQRRLPRPYSGVPPSAVPPVQRILWFGAD
jgi:hypothetical protein